MEELIERVKELERKVQKHNDLINSYIIDTDRNSEDIRYIQNSLQQMFERLSRLPQRRFID